MKSADVFRFTPIRKKPDADAIVTKGLTQFCDAFLDAIKAGDEGLCKIEVRDLKPSTRHMVQRFAEHLDDLEKLAAQIRVTRNLARFATHVSERGE